MCLRLASVALCLTLVIGCGALQSKQDSVAPQDEPTDQTPNVTEIDMSELSDDMRSDLEEKEGNLPEEIIIRIPVVNGVKQFDQTEQVVPTQSFDAESAEAVAKAFDNGTPGEASVQFGSDNSTGDELDGDSSTESNGCWRGYRGAYRGAPAWGRGYMGGSGGCGYYPSMCFRYRPVCRPVCRPCYRPYMSGCGGYNYGSYYYTSYRSCGSWYW